MKAAISHAYGGSDVISIEEIQKPIPKKNQVLVEVYMSTVSSADSRLRRGDPFLIRLVIGLRAPNPKRNVFGTAFSGVVSAVGPDVREFKVGDEVFGTTEFDFGAHAQFLCMPETGPILHKPESLRHEDAVLIPFGFSTAQYFLNKARIQKGDHLLVVGAGGALGSAAIQLAQYKGAVVTGIASGPTIPFLEQFHLEKVIDYQKEDISRESNRYDVIFDTTGKIPLSVVRKILKKGGRYVSSVHMNVFRVLYGLFISAFTSISIKGGTCVENKKDLSDLLTLLTQGAVKPLVGKTFSFEDIRKAHDYTDSREKVGNTLLSMRT